MVIRQTDVLILFFQRLSPFCFSFRTDDTVIAFVADEIQEKQMRSHALLVQKI